MSYTTLKTKIQNFIENDGSEFVASIDDIIAQAEAMVFQRLPNLPCFRNTFTGTLITNTSDYTIANARMIRQVCITDSSNKVYLNHRIDSYLRDYWPNSSTQGTPEFYSTKNASTSGTVVTLAPTPSAALAYSADFIAPATGLSSGNTTTWIGDNAENLLLSACLLEASAFLKAPETLTFYKAQFDESVQLFMQEMNRDYAAEYEGGI